MNYVQSILRPSCDVGLGVFHMHSSQTAPDSGAVASPIVAGLSGARWDGE